MRGPLYQADYRPLFSGHETFPLRYGWLKKAYDATAATVSEPNNKRTVFLADDAIAHFGVGKNMVASMRHWAMAAGIIAEDERKPDHILPTDIGKLIFGRSGLDPYMESPTTLWLVHWWLCGTPFKTTWFWALNYYTASTFRRDDLVAGLLKLAAASGWQRVAETTVRRDVECFVRTYAAPPSQHGAVEDNLECPLVELGLLRTIGRRDDYQFARGAKPTLTDGVFALALNAFWNNMGATRTLSFEAAAYEPGSPGRVFLLDEAALVDRLAALENCTSGHLRWSETAGLKQVVRAKPFSKEDAVEILRADYGDRRSGGRQ